MAFPNFENKHQNDAFFSPKDFLNYLQQINDLPEFEIPEALIFCYQNSLAQYIEKNEEITPVNNSFTRMWLLNSTGNKVGVCANFGIGAPAAAIILEEMVALGVKKFFSIGTAGSLQSSSDIGDIIVCNKAIRDEGVSHHYLAADKYAHPSPALTDRLKSELTKNDLAYTEGASWTIDAVYRETVAEARHYQAEGVITVEMEASALMAVAQYREVDLACAFVISDSLAELEWKPRFRSEKLLNNLTRLYTVAKFTLS